MSWELILFLAAAIHGIVLSILFLTDTQNHKKFFLGLYLLCFSITILHYTNYWAQLFRLPSYIQYFLILPSWAMPLAFYHFMSKEFNKKQFWYHLIIPSLFTIYWVTMQFVSLSAAQYLKAAHITSFSLIAIYLTYLVLILRHKMKWTSDWLFTLAFASFLVGLVSYKITTMTGTYTLRWDYITCAAFVILTYAITYFSEFTFLKEKVQPKYSSSSLTKEEGEYLVKKINKVLNEKRYYVEPDFNLSSFAKKLGVPKYRISQALNVYSSKSFSELVNELRIQEAKERLLEESATYLKLEAIGEEVGFRNKVSFYSNFKKYEGKSPGEFREQFNKH
ncbi:helix-turn-helix domain-containing protein [Portibacter marinus]|uniref:helix-turn-helix domain-containing protein n=1 Tax=Portibacter marinus TaxID=2898660 RepID=UPI001F433A71|nr:helix-turn-helix domain-containing protein [Portibacter marinus]